MAFIALTYDGGHERPALEVVSAAVPASDPPAPPPSSLPSGQPRIVAYIVGSEEVARELRAGLEHLREPSGIGVSVVVAETPIQAGTWKRSLEMAASEGVDIAVHDLTVK
jgi:hypothetical protein